jgi:predicted DNA-binding transcriptional regulator AlpA
MPEFLSSSQMAARYGVTKITWLRWYSKTPSFPKPLRCGRTLRWNPQEIDAFLKSQGA